MIGKVVQATDQLAPLYLFTQVNQRLPYSCLYARSVVFEISSIHEARRRRTERIDFHDLSRQHSIMLQHVANALVSMQHAFAAQPFSVTEFAANRNLARG